MREHIEGLGLQGIAGENGGGLVEGAVAGGAAAAQVVIVHGRQIVMHQRVGVDEFHRAGRDIETPRRRADGRAGGVYQERAHTLAATEHRIAHGLVQT